MYDLVFKEGMWNEIAISEGQRRRSFFQVELCFHGYTQVSGILDHGL